MEPVGKTVGRRKLPAKCSPEEALKLQDAMAAMYRERAICARGVFRFKSFEEADFWMRKQTAKNSLEHQRERTSRALERASMSTGSSTP